MKNIYIYMLGTLETSPELSVDVHGEKPVEEAGEPEGGKRQRLSRELHVAVGRLQAQPTGVAGGESGRGDLMRDGEDEKAGKLSERLGGSPP